MDKNQWEKNTFGYKLEALARTLPKHLAIICGDREITYKELDEGSNRVANALLGLGVKKGDKVAALLYNENGVEWGEVNFGVLKLGAIIGNINPRYVPPEMKYEIVNSDISVLILVDDAVGRIDEIRPELTKVKHYIVVGKNVPGDMLSYEELIGKYPGTKPKLDWDVKDNDMAFFLYTGGTTGHPKAAMWEHKNRMDGLNGMLVGITKGVFDMKDMPVDLFLSIDKILPVSGIGKLLSTVRGPIVSLLKVPSVQQLLNGLIVRLMFRPITAGIVGSLNLRFLMNAPIYHSTGILMSLAMILNGVTVVYLTSRSFNAKEMWEVIERRKINLMTLIGDAFAKPMLEELEKGRHYDLSSMLLFLSAGVLFSPENKKKLNDYIPGAMIADLVSTTEVGESAVMVTGSTDTLEEIRRRPRMKIVHGGPVRVINPETGEDTKPGEVGQIVYKGYTAKGYYGDDEKTKRDFRFMPDGKRWFYVGDMATVDENGFLYFIGRGATCVNTGGEKVYPEEVEEIIVTHPKVKDVAVIGLPDERWGEAVTAVVQLREGEKGTEDEIIDFCRDKMAGYKRPKNVIFVAISTFTHFENPDWPLRTLNGNLDRKRIKETVTELWKERKGEESK